MTTPELIAYVRSELAKGVPPETLRGALISAGWFPEDVSEALATVTPPAVPTIPQNSPAPEVAAVRVVQEVPHSGHKHALLYSILILVLVVFLGGGAYAYLNGYLPTGSSVTAQEVLANMELQKSVAYDGAFNIKINKNSGNAVPGFDLSELRFQFQGASEGDGPEAKGGMLFTIQAAGMEAILDLRAFNETLYVRVVKMPTYPGVDLSAYEGRWFSINTKTFPGQSQASALPGANYASLSNLTDEQKIQAEGLIKNASLVKFQGKNGSEELKGVATNRYLFDLDRPGIMAFFNALNSFIDSLPDQEPPLSSEEIAIIQEALNSLTTFQGEVWIGKNDKLPYRLTVATTSVEVDTNATINLSDWGVPVMVQKPEGAQDLGEMFGAQLETAQDASQDALIKNLTLTLVAGAELYWDMKGGTYKGFCASSEALSNAKTIKEKIQPASFLCKDSKTQYIFSAPLSSGQYYCVDSGFSRITMPSAPKGYTCK